MKLYATVTSERASKGQGGNEYLDIEIKDDNKEIIGKIHVRPFTDKVGDGVKVFYSFAARVYASETGLAKETKVKMRLEYLRKELRAERISYGEIAELQSLAEYIEDGDVELLEAAGVPEFEEQKGEKEKGEPYKGSQREADDEAFDLAQNG